MSKMSDYFRDCNNMLYFDEKDHKYTFNKLKEGLEKNFVSCTQLLKNMKIAKDFAPIADIDNVVEARERGKRVHSQIHFALDNGLKFPKGEEIEQEAETFVGMLTTSKSLAIFSEQKILNEDYMIAGTFDIMIVPIDDEKSLRLIDIKTSKKTDLWEAAWQLSIYRYMLQPYVEDRNIKIEVATFGLYGGTSSNVDIHDVSDYIPEEEVKALLDAHKNCIPYDNGKIVVIREMRNTLSMAMSIAGHLEALKAQITFKTAKLDEVKSKLYESMKSKDIKSLKFHNMTVSRIDAFIRKTLDSKRLKEQNPGIYEEFLQLSEVRPTVRFKFEKREENEENIAGMLVDGDSGLY